MKGDPTRVVLSWGFSGLTIFVIAVYVVGVALRIVRLPFVRVVLYSRD